MRLGGPIIGKYQSPEEWAAEARTLGYRAAYCPVDLDAPEDVVRAYASAAAETDIVIAEVGAWCNPLSPDDSTRTASVERCGKALALADAIGARCCVNIAGSRGPKWDGPCKRDLTVETFDLIIDSVRPKRAFYTLETMPWMYPDSVEAYLDLLNAIDRKSFAVHFDPVNLISSPQRYFANADIIRDFVAKLGPHIRSCHAKDILLRDRLTVHLDEVRPGCGGLDYRTYLSEVAKLPGDIPIMLEHLHDAEKYRSAASHILGIAGEQGIDL